MSTFTHPWHIKRAVETLKSGGVIAYPTEAVWGLGCDPWNSVAVERLLRLKSRAMHKGLILACGEIEQLDFLLHGLTPEKYQTLLDSWPGPNTWLVPDSANVIPQWVKGSHDTVAVRVSKHSLIKEMAAQFGRPIVSTSANPAGAEPAMNGLRIRQYFGRQIDYIVPGSIGGEKQPSRIRSLETGQVIRS
ncbi:L-threonylcarbamoyladenylate synthase [Alkalimarinus sediminis]|uniref:Threonylcarbamoyl-AMP synthase n=1 Tax=Alkalimarinus sediminis TaxID=1632866 RepID=A0A9E8KPS8_9ALTE|nr:L-threonylcarbamoyladenylate synthase [Alkalimarinus sediminis]UZW75049.1 L-threonylcarbamoyladenylate synthase [Alkalimarinus sediminis]